MTSAAHAPVVAELHCHTVASADGLITYDGLVETARRRRIDVVCITDHDTVEGAIDFRRRARASGAHLHIVVGEERTLDDGSHVIGLFLQEPILSTRFADVIAEVHAQGGVVVVPHPFRRKDGLWRGEALPEASHVQGVDAFELFNAKGSYRDNAGARALLALPLGVTGGSDAHYESDIGQCVCEVPLHVGPEESIRGMLARSLPFRIRAVPQAPGDGERRYAPLYYRIRPYVRVPRPLLPAAKQVYRYYRNHLRGGGDPALEEIFAHA
jgi:predicted metal-dependent phosphoesterase TrpH